MKYNPRSSIGCLLILLSSVALGQISTNGIADINPYAGLQPELIEGVSALPATGDPVIRHICFIDRHILALTIDERAVIYANLKPYTKQAGDVVEMRGYHGMSKLLVRKGEAIGYLCGLKNNWLRPFNMISGDKLDVQWAGKPGSYTLMSAEGPKPVDRFVPSKVFRKSYPVGKTHVSLKNEYIMRHEIYLVFEASIKQREGYTLQFNHSDIPFGPLRFTWDERRLRSEAIHVNMAGYHPRDKKVGFISTWLGDGGSHSYSGDLTFQVIDTNTSEVVFRGTAQRKSSGQQPEYSIKGTPHNHNLTDVYACDFSILRKIGIYRLVVSGVGCSFDFEISPRIWDLTAKLLMKGFLHQRSGIELGPPYTDYQRPRNMHPADETVINKCDPAQFFNPPKQARVQTGVFQRIQASILPETEVPEAWGGWMDAGDFDQRMSHLYSVRRMMYLHELNPRYFRAMDLTIPESTNKIPDILDEGAWCLDLYRRTQGVYEEGGISWWVESVEHPREGESSWLNSLPTALIPPTPRAGLHYAATATQMSLAVKPYDTSLARDYLESALAAVEWVDTYPNAPDPYGANPRPVIEALAYMNLYRCTGDKTWHDRLLKGLKDVFPKDVTQGASSANAEILAGYVLISDMDVDEKLIEECRSALVTLADDLLAGAAQNTFAILKSSREAMRRMVTLSRKVLPVVMAHHLTGEQKYLDALTETMQYTMGANPMNRSYISGLGERMFMPYQHDWEVDNLHKPAGIPNFGPTTQTETRWGWRDAWSIKRIENTGLYPKKLLSWPFAEKCFNNIWEAPTNEFTVRSPMGELLLLSGYLAQARASEY